MPSRLVDCYEPVIAGKCVSRIKGRRESEHVSHSGEKQLIPVRVIESDAMVRQFILAALQKDAQIKVLKSDSSLADKQPGAPEPIFVVDFYGLPLSLTEWLRQARFHFPEARFIGLDRDLGKEDLLRLLWFRIHGFVPYSESLSSLGAAVRSVAAGNTWFPSEVLREFEQCAHEVHQSMLENLARMTSRESEILGLVKRCLSNKEIANILKVQESTVELHLTDIYSKLQVSGRYNLISYARTAPELGALLQTFVLLDSQI